jgi:signal transduction histidine kinase/CheY-like chemotaxis protein/HPt (histidine-containing phosphotransfer) domain-containing protein
VFLTIKTLNVITTNGQQTFESAVNRNRLDEIEKSIKEKLYLNVKTKSSKYYSVDEIKMIDEKLYLYKIQLNERYAELIFLKQIINRWNYLKNTPDFDKIQMLYELDFLHTNIDRLALKEISSKQIQDRENIQLLVRLGITAGVFGFFLLLFAINLEKKQKIEKEKILVKVLESEKKAIESSKAKTLFLAMAGHELRTPLNGIIGLSELLRKSNLPKDATDFVDNIYQSGVSLLKIINNILDFAKIESGKIVLEKSDFSLVTIVQQIIMSLSIKAQQKNISLSYEIDKDIPLTVFGDASILSQVIYNLLGNAIKFTAIGTVFLTAKVHSYDQDKGVVIDFMVEDTGIGMTPEEQKKLFLPFNAIQTQGTRGEIGSGLGLAISAQLVKSMGGEIHVESNVGKGSTFLFTAYFSKFSKEKNTNLEEQKMTYIDEHKALSPIFSKDNSPLVLVVDDNSTNLLMAQAMLERLGTRTITATNGKEAIYEYSVNKIELILMDCQMPVMDGFEATKELRKQKCGIPILAMTANTAYEDQNKCFDAGMNGFIPKPISLKLLTNELGKYLNKNQDIVSLEVIDNLETVIGVEGMSKVIKNYLDELPKAQESLDNSIKNNNLEEIHKIGHKNKSSSQTVGAKSLSQMFKELEKVNELELAREMSEKLKRVSAEVKKQLTDHLTHIH